MAIEISSTSISYRLKRLRKLTGLSRDKLARLVEVTPQTISVWENSDERKITSKNLEKLLAVFKDNGVFCEVDWILYGTGNLPAVITLEGHRYDQKLFDIPAHLIREVSLFINLNPNAVVTHIADASMQPVLNKNDIVGGIWQYPSNIEIYSVAIVEINNEIQVRKIKLINYEERKYEVSFLNYSNSIKNPFIIENIILERIAPVIRIWR